MFEKFHGKTDVYGVSRCYAKEMNVLIEVENLVKKYGNHTAVDNLSFKVDSGKIYGFLGPNGAGKSTTMNIMTGYIAPTSGTVRIDGYDIQKNPREAKRHIGYLPEIPPVYVDMTVREYLEFVADLKKIAKSEREKQIGEVMAMTMLEDVSSRLIRNLSKGYRQRVGLAQAILGYPDVIILDEPTVGLDPKQIIEIRDLIRTLGANHTVILSSHILSEVQAVCDEIMIISHGKLVACDTADGLSNMMNKTAQLKLGVKGGSEVVKRVISEIANVQNVTVQEIDETQTDVLVETDADIDIREELFYVLAANRMPILHMERNEHSLEDIFLELTEDNADTDSDVADDQTETSEEVSDNEEA